MNGDVPRPAPAWSASDLTFRYPHAERAAVAGVTLDVPAGALTAVLGPNGSGKSTLLRLLLGTLRPGAGEARFDGRDVQAWQRAELARAVGVVPQSEEVAFPITVREIVAMGRYPHLGAWRSERAADRAAIGRALARCEVLDLADRPLGTLSGGERQRVLIARALAQEPAVLALDEPTAALDIRHEMAIWELLRALADGGTTVLVITHHLNLAARFADQLAVLERGRLAAAGAPAAVLTTPLVERVWGWPVRIAPLVGPGPDAGAPQVTPLAGEACRQMHPVQDHSAADSPRPHPIPGDLKE